MDQDGFFNDDISKMNSSPKKKIDDFTSFKDHTMDFLSHEQSYASEKVDQEKPKVDVDDFLNFHDDIGEAKEASPAHIPSFEAFEEPRVTKPEPEIDFHALEDDYMNSYAPPNLKGLNEPQNERFISSEDLLTDFKDPVEIEAPKPVEIPAEVPKFVAEPPKPVVEPPKPVVEPPKPVEVVKPPPVTAAPPKPVEEPVKPKAAPPPAPVKKATSDDTQIEAEKLFKSIGLVESLIYWRDVKKSGVVFGIGLAILLALSLFSLISVFAYLSLLTLGGTIAFRIYKTVMGAVQKTSEGHPFKEILDIDLTLQPEKVQNIAGVAVTHVNAYVAELRRLFLVEDLVDSLKFALLLWLLTYIGAIFNGMTVVILSYIAMFTLPKVYETNKQNIDQYLDLVRSKIMEITDKVKAAIPIGGAKKEESAKDK